MSGRRKGSSRSSTSKGGGTGEPRRTGRSLDKGKPDDKKGKLPDPVFTVGQTVDSYSDIGPDMREGRRILVTEKSLQDDDIAVISYPGPKEIEANAGARLVLLDVEERRDGKGYIYKFGIQKFEAARQKQEQHEKEVAEKRELKRGGEFRGERLQRSPQRFGEYVAEVRDKDGKRAEVSVFASTAWPSQRALREGRFDFKLVSDSEPWEAVLMYGDRRDEIRDSGKYEHPGDPLAWYEREGEKTPGDRAEVMKAWREAPQSRFSTVDDHVAILGRLVAGDTETYQRYHAAKTDTSKAHRPRIARAYFGADLEKKADGWNPNDADFVTLRDWEDNVFAEVMPETQFRVIAETAKVLANIRRIAPVLQYALENDRKIDHALSGNIDLQNDYRTIRQALMNDQLPRLFGALGVLRGMERNPEQSLSNSVVEELQDDLFDVVGGLEVTARFLRAYVPAGATSAVEGHIAAAAEFTAEPTDTKLFLRRLIESGRVALPTEFRTTSDIDALIEHIYGPAQELFERDDAGYLLVSDRGGEQYERFLQSLDQLIGEQVDWVPAFRFAGITTGGDPKESHPSSSKNYANKYLLQPNDLILDVRIGYGEHLLRADGSDAGAQELVFFDTPARRMQREQRVSEMQALALRPLADLDEAERTRLQELTDLVAYDAQYPYYQCTVAEFYAMVGSNDIELAQDSERQQELEFRTAIRNASVTDLIGYFQQKNVRYTGALEHINANRFNYDAVSSGTEVWSREAVHAVSSTMLAHARALLGDALTDNAAVGMRLHQDDTRSPLTSYFEFTYDGRAIPGTRVELSGDKTKDKAEIEAVLERINEAAPFQAELSAETMRRAEFEAEVTALLDRLSNADERTAALSEAPALYARLVDAVAEVPELESLRSQLESEFERARALQNHEAYMAGDVELVSDDRLQQMRDLLTPLGDFGFNEQRDALQERITLVESIYETRRLSQELEEAVDQVEDMTETGRAQSDLDILRPRIVLLRSAIDTAIAHADAAHDEDPLVADLREIVQRAEAVYDGTDDRAETLERLAANEVLAEVRSAWEQRVAEARSVRALLRHFTGDGAQLHDYSDECEKLGEQVVALENRIGAIDSTWRPDAARLLAQEGNAAYEEIARLLGARGDDTLRGFFELLREPLERMRGPVMQPVTSEAIYTSGSRAQVEAQVEAMLNYREMIEFVGNEAFANQIHIAPDLLAGMRSDLAAIDRTIENAMQSLVAVENRLNAYIERVNSIRNAVVADPTQLATEQDRIVADLDYYSDLIEGLAISSKNYDALVPEFSERITDAQLRIIEVALELQTMDEARVRGIEAAARGRDGIGHRVAGVLHGSNESVARLLGAGIGAEDQLFLIVRGDSGYQMHIGNREASVAITAEQFGELLLDNAAEIQYTDARTIFDGATAGDLARISAAAFGVAGEAHPLQMGERFVYVGDSADWPGDTPVPVGTRVVLLEQSSTPPYNFVFARVEDVNIQTGRLAEGATRYELTPDQFQQLLATQVDGGAVFAPDRDNPQYLVQRLDRGEHVFSENILASFAPQALEIGGERRYRLRLREAITDGDTTVLAANAWFDIPFVDGSPAHAFNDTLQDITVRPLNPDGTYAEAVRIPYESYVRTISRGYTDWDMSWEQHRDSQEARIAREYGESFAVLDPTTRNGLIRTFSHLGHTINPDGRARRPSAFEVRIPSEAGAGANPTIKCTDVRITQTGVELWYNEPSEGGSIVRQIELSYADFYSAFNRNPENPAEFNMLNVIVDPSEAQWSSARLDAMRGKANLTDAFLKDGLLYHGQRAEFKLSLRGVEIRIEGEAEPRTMSLDDFNRAFYNPGNPAVTERADRGQVGDYFSTEWARDLRGAEYELLMEILVSPRGIGLADFARMHNPDTGMYVRAELTNPRTVRIHEMDADGNLTGRQQQVSVVEFLQSVYFGEYELPAEIEERRRREAAETAARRPVEVEVEIYDEDEDTTGELPEAPEPDSTPTVSEEGSGEVEPVFDDSALSDEERVAWPRLRNRLSRRVLQERAESMSVWGAGRRRRQAEAIENIVSRTARIQQSVEAIGVINRGMDALPLNNDVLRESLAQLRTMEANIRSGLTAPTNEQYDALIEASLQPRLLGGGMNGNLEQQLQDVERQYIALQEAFAQFQRLVELTAVGRLAPGETLQQAFIRELAETLDGRYSRTGAANRFEMEAFLDDRQYLFVGEQAYRFERFNTGGYEITLTPVDTETGERIAGEPLNMDQPTFVNRFMLGAFGVGERRES